MKRASLGFLLLLFGTVVHANGYEDGLRYLSEESYASALVAFRAAAAEGNAAAERQIGFMYYKGIGLKQDDAEAVRWFERAATHGDLESQVNLGIMYENGLYVAQSDDKSAHWFRIAAEQGHRWSQFRYGQICFLGAGVPKDQVEAVKWWRLATQPDDDTSRRMNRIVQSVVAKLPRDTLDEGQMRAAAWLDRRSARK